MTQKENAGLTRRRQYDVVERRFVFEDDCEREYKDVRIRVYPDDAFSATGEGAYTVGDMRVVPREARVYPEWALRERGAVDDNGICRRFIESSSGASFDVVGDNYLRRIVGSFKDALERAHFRATTAIRMMDAESQSRAILALIEAGAPGARILTAGLFRTPRAIITERQDLLLAFQEEWLPHIIRFSDSLSRASYENGRMPVELVARAIQVVFAVTVDNSRNKFAGLSRLLLAPAQYYSNGVAADAKRLLDRAFDYEQQSTGWCGEYLAMMGECEGGNCVAFIPATWHYSSLVATVQRGAGAAMHGFKPLNAVIGERIRYGDAWFTDVEKDKSAAPEWRMASAVIDVIVHSWMRTSPYSRTPVNAKDCDIERFTAVAMREGASRVGWATGSGVVSAPQSASECKTKKAIRATRAAAERMLPFLLNEDVF